MNLGIITWHFLDNCWSMLQEYAMIKIFEKYGYNVEIINYREGAKTGILSDLLREIKYLISYKDNTYGMRKKKNHIFRKKHFKETKIIKSNEDLLKYKFDYDIYVCGSDQIWSPTRFDLSYYLNFVPEGKTKIAYAPSLVIDSYSSDQINLLKEYLPTFTAISLREETGSEIMKRSVGEEYPVVLDPTLMLDVSVWDNLSSNVYEYNDFILCYFIGNDDKYKESVYKFAKKIDKKIISIVITDNHHFGDIIIKDADPSNFIELVKKSSCVLTDSFHGVLFAINFQKDFYAYERFKADDEDNQNQRIENILGKIELMNRIINENHNFLNDESVDYTRANQLLEKERASSYDFLNKALGVCGD